MHTTQQLLQDLPSAIWQKVAAITHLHGQWVGGADLHPQTLQRLRRSVVVTSTGASTRIEGSKLTDDEIDKLMRGIAMQHFSDRDSQEVRGYFELLSNVFESWEQLHFSENLVQHFHQELLKYVDKDVVHRGHYKQRENKVHMVDAVGDSIGVLFDTTPAYLTPAAMTELTNAYTRDIHDTSLHPLLVIGAFVVNFLHIHPFEDGNGRLSRILTNLLLLQAGYAYMPFVSHEKLIEDNKAEYYVALRTSQKTLRTTHPTIVPWLDFFLDIMLQQVTMAVQLLTGESFEKLLSPTQFRVWEYIQQHHEATPLQLSELLAIPRPTINQVADKLLALQKIERIGEGRAVRYRLVRTK